MPYMTRLLPDLQAAFPRVDTVPGWETRGNSSFNPAVVVCHWTAGPRATTKRASLNVVVNGRPGLAGPLSQVYLDRAGIPVIVAAGRANHAGPGGWRGVVGNSGAYGIEAEAAGPDDWTNAQREAYPLLVAAMLRGLGRDAEWTCGHAEWATPTGRKQDINGWPMDAMRAEVAAILNGDDMPLSDADIQRIRHAILFDETILKSGVEGDQQKPTNLANQVLYAAAGVSTLMSRQVGYGKRIENTESLVKGLGADALKATIRDAVTSALKGTTPGAAIDPGAIAEHVADELARRMAG